MCGVVCRGVVTMVGRIWGVYMGGVYGVCMGGIWGVFRGVSGVI